jgi:hypothetical protein
MKFFSLLLDPTKKSVKIPNSKLKYAFYCPLNGPLDEILLVINKTNNKGASIACWSAPSLNITQLLCTLLGEMILMSFFFGKFLSLDDKKIPCNV